MSEPVGRPTKMTPETIAKLEEAFLLGCGDVEACLYADISKTTLYNYQLEHPEFVDRKEQLKENPILLARTSVVNKLSQDADLALKFLERRKKDEFSLKSEVAIDHKSTDKSMSPSASRLSDMTDKIRGVHDTEK